MAEFHCKNCGHSLHVTTRDVARKERSQQPLTQELLQELLVYDPVIGRFRNRVARGNSPEGKIVGSVTSDGYRQVTINWRVYSEHRLAWFYVYGVWPEELDHINGDRLDSRISNLRECTRSQNQFNRRKGRTTPLKGAHKYRGVWKSVLYVNKKAIYLGKFNTAEEAHDAYVAASKKYHKEFGRTD